MHKNEKKGKTHMQIQAFTQRQVHSRETDERAKYFKTFFGSMHKIMLYIRARVFLCRRNERISSSHAFICLFTRAVIVFHESH